MTDDSHRWAQSILALQHDDGSWGRFHSMGKPTRAQPMTTEQALRRLRALGLTRDDEPIARALDYMRGVLRGERRPPDGREKVLNWDAFEAHMMAAWIRIFDSSDALALPVARLWAELITRAFAGGAWDPKVYAAEYRKQIPALHKGERLISLSQFYMVNLLQGQLDSATESRFVDAIIKDPNGIYYVYSSRIADPPAAFASRQTSQYLAALEQLAGYACAGEKLRFAAEWLLRHQDDDGTWDMGSTAKDGTYFPLSASWRKPEDRRRDCTARVGRLLGALGKERDAMEPCASLENIGWPPIDRE